MNRDLIKEATDIVIDVMTVPTQPPRLGLDLDGTITEAPEFFKMLSEIWPNYVYVITYRSDYEKAKKDVDSYGINYEELILVDSFEKKAEVIVEKEIGVYFDDQPEMLKNITKGVQVMLVRNEGNFDFRDKRWVMSNITGKIV